MGIDIREMLTVPAWWRADNGGGESAADAEDRWYGRRREQVISLLQSCDGYTWEDELSRELGWSSSTIRRTLEEMEATGRIIRYQVGQRCVICAPQRAVTERRQPQRTVPGP